MALMFPAFRLIFRFCVEVSRGFAGFSRFRRDAPRDFAGFSDFASKFLAFLPYVQILRWRFSRFSGCPDFALMYLAFLPGGQILR